ncbi:hypothetical protein PO124_33005 [Bacillus licheniformis]|nr:hypothetical protein [Bacillus licheniformis]
MSHSARLFVCDGQLCGILDDQNVYFNAEAAGFSVLNGILSIIMLVLGLVIMLQPLKWTEIWRDPALRMEPSIPG